VSIAGGTNQILRLDFAGGEFNIDKIQFVQTASIDCNGDVNGTAYFDNCAQCVGGNTGKNPCATQTIYLNKGWNIISFNVSAADMKVTSVFSSVMGNVSLIKTQQSIYSPSLPSYLNSLQTIAVGDAYLVKMDNADTLSVDGTSVGAVSKMLVAGWNLCGYPRSQNMSISNAFADIFSSIQNVKNFEGFYVPGSSTSSLTELKPGEGYFIKVSSSCVTGF